MSEEGRARAHPGSASRRVVVVVGRRRAARSAARRLGLELIELDREPRPKQAIGGYGGGAEPTLEAVRDVLGERSPAAVVAGAEGAVPAAAAIRRAYRLPGVDPEAALRCHDKVAMKRAITAAGLPCAPWRVVEAETTADELVDHLGLPIVLKTPVSSGGRGVRICGTRNGVALALQSGQLAEAFLEGVEMSVESLVFGGAPVFRNPTRYLKPRWANVVPAALAPADLRDVDALADAVHTALGVTHGMTHMELFLTAEGPVFGEIAARPPGGYLMELLERAYGFDPWAALMEIELGSRPTLPNVAGRAAGVWILHPGAGEVAQITGVEAARALPGVARVRVAVEPGDTVPERVGSGQAVGEVVVEADDHDSCVELLQRARAAIEIKMCG